MARKLEDLPNVLPPDSDYPYGRVQDNPGDQTGTPVNELTTGDFWQFFAKLMDEAGITPNELPDNEYSGFQLFDSLIQVLRNDTGEAWHVIGGGGEPAFQNSWTNLGSGRNGARYKKIGGRVYLSGAITGGASGSIAFTLPVGYRPAGSIDFGADASLGNPAVGLVSTGGSVLISYSATGNASFEGMSFPID